MQNMTSTVFRVVAFLWALAWRLVCLIVVYRCVTGPEIGVVARPVIGGMALGTLVIPSVFGVCDLVPGFVRFHRAAEWIQTRGWYGRGMRSWWWRSAIAGALTATLAFHEWWAALGCAIVYMVLASMLADRGATKTEGSSLRGSQITDPRFLGNAARRRHGLGTLRVGDVTLPKSVEPYHLLVTGGTGQGKSVGITTLLDGIHSRGDRVIVADSGGGFLRRYGFDARRGDIILNPLDARAVPWSPLAEIRVSYHADAVAHALVPDAEGPEAPWHQQAQTFLSGVLNRVYDDRGDNRELLRLALEADMPELREKLAGTPAAGQVGEGNERMFNSVRATVASHLACLRYCPADAGREAFSVREWATLGQGWAFLNYLDDQLRVLAPLAGALLALAASGVMTQTPDARRRTWLILDEVAALGKIGALEDFLTRARKSGGCAIVGLQSIAQLRQRYGRNGAESMLSCLSSQLVLNGSDPDTADFLSRMIGDVQVARRMRSAGSADHGANSQWSQTVQTERLILPSEISSLPKLCGFLRLTGGLPVAPVRLRLPVAREELASRFVPGDLKSALRNPTQNDAHGSPGVCGQDDLPDFDDSGDEVTV